MTTGDAVTSPVSALQLGRLKRPFSIGLSQLDPDDWIVPDANLARQLAEKVTHFTEHHDAVFRAEPETREAQQEVLDRLLDYLPARYPAIWKVSGGVVSIIPADLDYPVNAFADRPLELAARLVQDDLVLMRKGTDGYRIAAAALCFPATWLLAEKFGRAIADVHGPVPGFGPGTRTAGLIDRIFDNLKAGQPVERCNWSIYEVPDLHHPYRQATHTRWREVSGDVLDDIWLRAERQTLSRLPRSGDIVFTIQTIVDPGSALLAHPRKADVAATLLRHLGDLGPEEIAYKGLTGHLDQVIAELARIASREQEA